MVNDRNHEWHCAINNFHDERRAAGDNNHRGWMYHAKDAALEVPRLTKLFAAERLGKLPAVHRQCSRSPEEPVPDNHLTCCLGVKCASCPELLALERAALPPEQIDEIRAWTCVGHILESGGDPAGEGFVLTVDDRMYWSRLYTNLAQAEES